MSHGPADAAGAPGPDELPDDDLTLTMPRVTGDEPRVVQTAPVEVPDTDWSDDDLVGIGGRDGQLASGLAAGLAAVPYLRAALRRRARVWCATALIGLALGIGLITLKPPGAKAQTQVYVTDPGQTPEDAILTDVALLQTQSLAERAMHQLGLTGNIGAFMSSFTPVALTDRVIEIIVAAPTSSEAETRANVIATTFLQYRNSLVRTQEQAAVSKINSDLNLARQQVADITNQLSSEQAQPSSTLRTDMLTQLTGELNTANAKLDGVEGAAADYEVTTDESNAQQAAESYQLYKAMALKPSKYKKPDVYAIGGLLAGLILGMVYVAASALMTDRLRRRDDVSLAVGAPVRLSVGVLRLGPAGRRGRLSLARALTAASSMDVQRMAAQLQGALPEREDGAAALAVIATDNSYAAVLPVLALALSCARSGGQVIIADLSADTAVGRMLGFTEPGVRIVTVDGEQIALVVPDPDDLVPIGPLPQQADSPAAGLTGSSLAGRSGSSGARASRVLVGQPAPVHSTASYQLAAAYESADVLLTVATLDPALGSQHLPTWATDAVVVVTAGESTATKIHSVSEMARLAGTEVRFALLVGADKRDESIGMVTLPEVSDAASAEYGASADSDSGADSDSAAPVDPVAQARMNGEPK